MKKNEVAGANLTLFDEHGRCIPAALEAAAHLKTRRYFTIKQPEFDYGDVYARTKKYLGISGGITAAEFEQRAEAILQNLRDDPASKDITNGIAIPFLLPQASYADYGESIENTYLKAVGDAFNEKLPQYVFVNHYKNSLAGKINVIPASRHARLLDAMQHDQVVGYYFPCLTEFSVPAAIEQVQQLPDQFLLAGGFDTCAALIAAPDLLLKTDAYPPLLWLASLMGENTQSGYHFEAYGYNLTFNHRPHFNQLAEYWASGLVVLG
ncbi:MAG: hypothetical protein Q8O37_02715 [Sulfuricellaceae bacterium]|nr:hypothetical protein [Sulfuricellaceae bacterium]